jgi:hypothetical protein
VTHEKCPNPITGFIARHFNSSSRDSGICVLLLLLVATSGLALAADQKSNPNPCNIGEKDAPGLTGDLGTDLHAGSNYSGTIARMLKEERFEELDCLADHARSGKERFSGGGWKLHALYAGLETPIQYPITHATQEDWNIHLQRLQRWVTTRPKSITARVALASAYLDYDADARGDGYANTVSQTGWKLFAERTAEAKRILDEASALPTKCPEWYSAMQEVAQSQNWGAARERALFEQAFQFEPAYHYYADTLAYYLLPKWDGAPGDTEKFMQEVADRIGGDHGDTLYFQVAASSYLICGCEEDPHLSMERIERGFEASEKLYGVSLLNLNRIAFLASNYRENDAIFADKVLSRIGEQWDGGTWKTKQDFDSVKQWATRWAPIVAQRHAMEAAAQTNMQTPEGSRYKASFENTYRELVQQCVRTDGSSEAQWEGKFKTFVKVGAKGSVEDGAIYAMGPVVMCLQRKLQASRHERSPLFPPPPQAPYWVRLELDWADFAPVAS